MWFWLFIVSFLLNIFLLYYVRWLFKTLTSINQDIELVVEKLNDFSAHLSSVHEMEMFYGDDTLQGLLSHAADLSKDLLNLDLLLNDQEGDTKEETDIEEEKKTQDKK